ncbi:unnamed protein product [Effrenium voratum]|uniref:Ion transport domain-containing protein n=1 Tax=Effrenium voratum TaxID=2562239 RepID=A0AA36IIZ0_9DINO|nr:unnamed protein product [Effrenium voratum]CAJ1452673.1 unnamed protein product [Effrenium voratum]
MPLPGKLHSLRSPLSAQTEDLLQECMNEGWEQQKWAMNSSDSSSGLSDSSSEDNIPVSPHSPNVISPQNPNSSPETLSLTRVNSVELQRALDSFTAFRASLVGNHQQTLQMLDKELEKMKMNIAKPPSKQSAGSAKPAVQPVKLPGVLGLNQGERPVERKTLPNMNLQQPMMHFQSIDKQRKRRMSWITKTATVGDFGLHDSKVHPAPSLPKEPEVEQLNDLPAAVAHITKDQRAQAKRDAEKSTEAGMLSNFNADLAKNAVRQRAAEELEQVPDLMKTEGRLAAFAKHPWFERTTMSVIFLNAIWISIDIEFNKADIISEADAGFVLVENLFCTYFTLELLIRYCLYKKTSSAFKDAWFLFDLMLVTLMIFETWAMAIVYTVTGGGGAGVAGGASVLRVARIMRVLRTARMARLVRLMPELMILIKGMMVACRSVFFTLVLLLLITYVFSVAFMQFSRGTALEQSFFSDMGTAVMSLILNCILADQEAFFQSVAKESWFMACMVLIFILFGSLTVMNMLLGVLVEAIKTVSTIEREQLEVDFAKKALWELINKGDADEDGDNRISEQEFMNVLQKPQAVTALTSLGVDVEAALDYGKLLFEDGEPLTFGDFMKGILTLRGSNQTTVKDIIDLRKFTADEFSQMHDILKEICNFLVGQGFKPPPPSGSRFSLSSQQSRGSYSERSTRSGQRIVSQLA